MSGSKELWLHAAAQANSRSWMRWKDARLGCGTALVTAEGGDKGLQQP